MERFLELKSDSEWRLAFVVMQELRPKLDLDSFLSSREELISRGYRLFGLFCNDRIVSCAGVAIHPHIERGSEFWIHDLVTLSEERSRGHGESVIRALDSLARREGFGRVLVHTRISRADAQRFYEDRAKYEKYAIVYEGAL